MNKVKVLVIAIVVGVLSLAVGQTVAATGYFASTKSGEVVVEKSDTIDSTAFLAGTSVIINGTVQGDVFCAGQNITINGTVEGDVICGGQNITIAGTVRGDVRSAGSTIAINGIVGGSVTVASSDVSIGKDAKVGRDLTGASSSLTVSGAVGRDLLLAASTVTLNGNVGRDVNAAIGSLVVSSTAKIGNNLSYESSKELTIPTGVVSGKVNFTKAVNKQQESVVDNPVRNALIGIAGLMVAGLLFALVAPKYLNDAASQTFKQVTLSFLIGFAFLTLAPILAILLASTVIGGFAAIILLVLWGIVGLLSGIFTAYYIGKLVLQKQATNVLFTAVFGALLVGLVLQIPILNIIAFVFIVFTGAGMQIAQLKNQFVKQPYKITN